MRRTLIIRTAVALVVLLSTGLTACRDDSGTIDAKPVDMNAYCAAAIALESAPPPDLGETTAPDEITEIVRAYANGTLQPLTKAAVEAAPDDVDDSLGVIASAVDEVADSGDFEELDSDSFGDATQQLHDYNVGACKWGRVDVQAVDYAFAGLPATLPAGPASFELANQGAEYHELVLVRKNAGVTQTAEQLLALPDEEALNLVTFVNQGDADPSERGSVVADLTPGTYVVACFVPVGTTRGDTEPSPDAPPHTSKGMYAEFTVN